MATEPICREIDPGSDYLLLDPGVYLVNSHGRMDTEEVAAKMKSSYPCSCINNCFCGMLLPFFLHNMNNLLVGVTGNIDLAGMFMPDLARVQPKINSARTATGSLVEYIRDLAGTLSTGSDGWITDEAVKNTMILLRAACGRSVSTESAENMRVKEPIPCNSASTVLTALNGMVTWCVISLGGSGSVQGNAEQSEISFTWQRPAGAGLPQMPGGEHSTSVISMTGSLAQRADCVLVVENWTENSGKVSLVIK